MLRSDAEEYRVNASGLERDRAGNLQCVSLVCGFARKFMKILKAHACLAPRKHGAGCEPETVDLVVRRCLFRRNRWAPFVRSLPLAVPH